MTNSRTDLGVALRSVLLRKRSKTPWEYGAFLDFKGLTYLVTVGAKTFAAQLTIAQARTTTTIPIIA